MDNLQYQAFSEINLDDTFSHPLNQIINMVSSIGLIRNQSNQMKKPMYYMKIMEA
ncbi:hypothetical protein [Morganella morganii]|uniref:hypothetical protein n=1 Tax=Morganella morganii TaxID=582 RepID=UPI003EC2E1EE